jgi:hypothetical protein
MALGYHDTFHVSLCSLFLLDDKWLTRYRLASISMIVIRKAIVGSTDFNAAIVCYYSPSVQEAALIFRSFDLICTLMCVFFVPLSLES